MSVPAESVTQSTQSSNNAPLVIERNVTTAQDFDNLWESGAFDSKDEAKARAEAPKEKPVKAQPVAEAPAVEAPEASDADKLAAADEQPVEAKEEDTSKTFDSLADYLKDAGVEEESFMDLPVTVKVDGQDKPVALKDVIKDYQLASHTQLKSLQQAEERRSFEQERFQVQQALKQQAEQSLAVFQLAQEQLLADFKGIDWRTLEGQDPGRAALLKQDYNARLGTINAHLQNLTQAKEMEVRRAEEDHARTLPQEREKMLGARPEWKDPGKFDADKKVIIEQGTKRLGYSPDELGKITDHRHLLTLHYAAQYLALQAGKPAVLKQVRAAPVMSRPGARVDRNPKVNSYKNAVENMSRNPRSEDAQAAVFEHFV